MERLSIHFSKTFASIDVQRSGVTRSANGRAIVSVIHNMQQDDRDLLAAFCTAVVACVKAGDCRALSEF